MSTYLHQGNRFKKSGVVYTPSHLSEWLFHLLNPIVQPQVVLDPCIGGGSLCYPWWERSRIVGVDIRDSKPTFTDLFIKYSFEHFTTWSHPQPDLVLCNPPFNGGSRMMYPEVFTRKVTELFGNKIPFVLITPHGFRLNCSSRSKRRNWFKTDEAPKITSTVSLPLDVFPGVKILTEILIFNVPGLEPHYWY